MKDSHSKKKLTTSQLLSFIKKSKEFSEVTSEWHDHAEIPVFCHYLYEVMNHHQLTPKDIISSSGIERSYFYHLLSGQKTPGRNMVIRIGLCMNASLQEMNQLLRLAGQGSLYPKVRRDAAIIFAFSKGYTMQQTNEFLNTLHEIPLYQEEK